jgi:hypothetical protein
VHLDFVQLGCGPVGLEAREPIRLQFGSRREGEILPDMLGLGPGKQATLPGGEVGGTEQDYQSAGTDGYEQVPQRREISALGRHLHCRGGAQDGRPNKGAALGVGSVGRAGATRERDLETKRELPVGVLAQQALQLGRRQAQRVTDGGGQPWIVEARDPATKIHGPRGHEQVLEGAFLLGDLQAERAVAGRPGAGNVGHQGPDL